MPSNDRTRRIKNTVQQETAAYIPPKERAPQVTPSKTAKKSNALPWLLGGAACLGVMCCGGLGVGGIIWFQRGVDKGIQNVQHAASERQRSTAERQRQQEQQGIQIEIDPAIKTLQFGEWTKRGHEMRTVVTAPKENAGMVRWRDFEDEQFDAAGNKLHAGQWLNFPELKPGESGKADIMLKEGTVRLVIRPSKR